MFQQSLFSSARFSNPDRLAPPLQKDSEALYELVSQPSPQQPLGASGKSSCRAGTVSAQTTNGINRSQIIADTQTPILDRFAPDSVVPLPELFAVYQAVDQCLATLLERSTTVTEVACAFAAEPYACYGNAVRVIGEANLLKKVMANLRSLELDAALQRLAQLPPFFQEKVWAQFTRQEQRQFVQVSKRIRGGTL